jgi:hypothetical protein
VEAEPQHEDERAALAEALRAVRDRVADLPVSQRSAEQVLGAARAVRAPEAAAALAEPAPQPDVSAPDGTAVNARWDLRALLGSAGWLRRWLRPLIHAQTDFNSHQVQFDNTLVAWVEARLAQTHRHYDTVLGLHGRHLQEIDQRHLQLQQDLVGHVHDLVQRLDLVLGEVERGRLSAEVALRDVRARLLALEARVEPPRDPRA